MSHAAPRHRATSAASVLLAVSTIVLGGCGSEGGPTTGVDPDDDQVAVSEVRRAVDYYGACGNEVLTLDDDRRLYPLPEDEVEDLADHPVEAPEAGATRAARAAVLPRVPAPGPGDDVGTLVIYDDGYARFESDSGAIVRWLTTAERSYDFVC